MQNKLIKKLFLISVMVCIILAACSGEKTIPPAFSSFTPESSLIATSTITSTPSKIRPTELFSTPTITPFPAYQTNGVIFDYYVLGNHADYDVFFTPESCCSITRLILYDDRQMIMASEAETYKQKTLSSNEMKEFLSKLETLGFYSLESNQKHDPTDKLYDYGNRYQEINDGLKYCILVNADRSRNLCAYEPHMQFLIPKMKNILNYLDEYEPAGMTPYYPDRILLTIQLADPSIDNPPAIPWNEHFPSLDSSTPTRYVSDTSNQVIYIDGNMAKEIYLVFEGTEAWKVFSQNGKEYIVYVRVLLPHEKVRNPYQ